MTGPVRDTDGMIAGMKPVLAPDVWVFVTGAPEALARQALATYREAEGLSLILPRDIARQAVLSVDLPMRCITLSVHSALDGVGLTAAVATALAQQGIPCNMVAAYQHDHVFVPEDKAQAALDCLLRLARSA